MSIESLFPQCRVLEVDPNTSLAKYLRSAKQTQVQVRESEEAGELEQAAVLQIRVLQLICKTLPSHPEYTLDESAPLLKDLRGVAHTGFTTVSRLAAGLSARPAAAATVANGDVRRRARLRRVEIGYAAVELVERVFAENVASGVASVALLAGRRMDGVLDVSAVVVPSQRGFADRAEVRYERDVANLFRVKELLHRGVLVVLPGNQAEMTGHSARLLARAQRGLAEAFCVVVAPRAEERVRVYSVRQKEEENEEEGWEEAGHVDIRKEGEMGYKLYDLRPLAAVRDEEEGGKVAGVS